jgi:hypothetical protein
LSGQQPIERIAVLGRVAARAETVKMGDGEMMESIRCHEFVEADGRPREHGRYGPTSTA